MRSLFTGLAALRYSRIPRFAAALLILASYADAQLTINGFNGLTASIAPNGVYSVVLPLGGWQLHGGTGFAVYNARAGSGSNALGDYQELAFDYNAGPGHRSAWIRAYTDRPVLLFSVTWNNAAANTAPFPAFSAYPSGLFHLSYGGIFGSPTFSDLGPNSPWVFFDASANTLIVSPASHFMTAALTRGAGGNEIDSGISPKIALLPAGLTMQTAVVFGPGINATLRNWGTVLTDLSGKQRPANDADRLLKSISYWTDNGATYYYNPGGPSYTDTLKAIKDEFTSKGIGLGSMQLDSWWYPKGPDDSWSSHGGIWTYRASPAIFQPDLASFQAQIGVPLVAHARWIDANSPYRSQYQMSGNVAIDPRYWEEVAGYLAESGVATYEQDWLNQMAAAKFDLTDPDAFLDNMAASFARRGMTMQFCMPDGEHFLQASRYSNLTTIRTSQDGFGPERWTPFLYAGQVAAAVGAYPFTDVFRSSETDNLILATLSAGPVGIGDALGSISRANLLKAVRSDGVIVKPDLPAMPDDSVYIADAQGLDRPMLASTYTEFGANRFYYLFAYARGSNAQVTIDPSTYGVGGPAYLFDMLGNKGRLIPSGTEVTEDLAGRATYYVLSAVGKSGIAFLGDNGNFASMGRKRISSFSDAGQIDLTVSFAPGEKVRTLIGYSPGEIQATALAGAVDSPKWNAATELFILRVRASRAGSARIRVAQASEAERLGSSETCGARCRTPAP